MIGWITRDRMGPLGGKWRPLVGKGREYDVKSRHLQGWGPMSYLPWVSIERTDRMLIYGPSKLMWLCNHLAETSLPYSKAVVREGEWGDPRQRPGQSVFSRQDFSRVYGHISISWGLAKSCLHGPPEMYDRGPYADRAWKACGILVRFSTVGCTLIQITATLEYEYRLFVAVIT
jgi:hypothetical protein